MEKFSLGNLVDLIKEVGEQDASAEISISTDDVDTSFDTLGVDSLTLLSVVAQLENQYGVSIGMQDAAAAKTLGELFLLVKNHLTPISEVA
jgi:acyl carrier protein